MKPPIVFEVYELLQNDRVLGRIIGSNIHIGDYFTSANLRRVIGKNNDEYIYESIPIINEIKIEILAIEAYGKQIEWLHAPYGACLTLEKKHIDIFNEYVKGISPELGIVELTGPYSEKKS
jgi:hypothetical protein